MPHGELARVDFDGFETDHDALWCALHAAAFHDDLGDRARCTHEIEGLVLGVGRTRIVQVPACPAAS